MNVRGVATAYQYRIGQLHIIELQDMPHGRTWAIQPEDDYIVIQAGLNERERRRALAEALAALVAKQQ